MEKKPSVLVAAPVRDREKHLPKYLSSLYNLNYPKERMGFYFLLNDSTDNSKKILEEFQLRYSKEYREITIEVMDLNAPKDRRTADVRPIIYGTLATLRNAVLDRFRDTTYQYLFSVDSDIYVEGRCLSRLVDHQKDFVAALISNMTQRMWPNAMVKSGHGYMPFRLPEGDPGLYEVDLTGAVCLMSRRVLSCKYSSSRQGEDLPFCQEVQAAGMKLYLDTAPLARHDMRPHD